MATRFVALADLSLSLTRGIVPIGLRILVHRMVAVHFLLEHTLPAIVVALSRPAIRTPTFRGFARIDSPENVTGRIYSPSWAQSGR